MLRDMLKRLVSFTSAPAATGDSAANAAVAAHLSLGAGLEAAGDRSAAARCYAAALAIDPGNAHANYNLGKLMFIEHAYAQAGHHLRAALERKPEFPEAHVVLSSLHDALGDHGAAAASLETALRQKPDYAGAWYNYATTLVKLDRLAEAEAAARRAISFDPEFLSAYTFLGDFLRSDARLGEAIEMFQKARAVAGGGIALEQAELHALNYFDGISDQTLFEKHCQAGARIETAYPARFLRPANSRDPERRLRIGYLSRDFRRHPVALFLIPALERHDRSGFEVYCYSSGADTDDVTAQVRLLTDHWLDAATLSHAELADAIHRDGVDILVDLLGHAGTSNLAVFAQQPAPVQVSWLGYLNTTGLKRMQYRLCDAVSDPPGISDQLHTEALVRLPHGQWCYRPYRMQELSMRHAPELPCRRKGFITFGSFNHQIKLSPAALALWMRILRQQPDSRMVILGVPGGAPQDRLLGEFTRGEIAASRITIVPPVPLDAYFRWFDEVDLALDSTPYSGGTTTCDTLWMGVPVVTLAGTWSAARSGASIMTTVGLKDWIARSADEYVELALKFARDEATLTELRRSLRRRMQESPLMDELGFARNLESAYRGMWRTWCTATER